MLPAGQGLRVVGDVHGDSNAFAAAANTDRFIIQLGDLVDDGPDTPGVLELMFRLIEGGRGLFVLGNHEFKLLRALRGHKIRQGAPVERTMAELSPGLAARAETEIARAPVWIHAGARLFVHGAFHPAMLLQPAPAFSDRGAEGLVARAIYGQTTGRVTGAGRPERLLDWVEDVPAGLTVYCGHDRRSTDGRPWVRQGVRGGRTVFMDTGAGKGGHLSWIDLEPDPV